MDANDVDALKLRFNQTIEEFYGKLADFVVMKGSKVGVEYGMPVDAPREELIKRMVSAKADYVIEVGPDSGKLHSHGMLCFSKRGVDTKLDYEAIKKWLEEKMGFPVYFKNEMWRDAKKNLKEYIAKAPAI